jgi:predicted dehydrogenase
VRGVWPLLPTRVCRDALLRAAAVADTVPEAARKAGEEFAVPVCADIHALAARDDVQIVHIATPPSTH